MKIISIWMWLEAIGFPNIVDVLRTFPDVVLDAFVEEALICLYFIESDVVPQLLHEKMKLTYNLLQREFSVQYLYENRERVRAAISKKVNDVLIRAFEDILQEVAETKPTGIGHNANLKVEATVDGHILIMENGQIRDCIMPYHVGPKQMGDYSHSVMPSPNCMPREGGRDFHVGESSSQAASRVILFDAVATANRTLFLIFQVGHIITVEELRDFFFANNCGDMIEAILMDQTAPNSAFRAARVVLRSEADVARVLNGNQAVKIVIDGKYVLIKGM